MFFLPIAIRKNAIIRGVEQALEFVDAVCATGLASGQTNRCTRPDCAAPARTALTDEIPTRRPPPPNRFAPTNVAASLRPTAQADYDGLAARAEADPAWLMEE